MVELLLCSGAVGAAGQQLAGPVLAGWTSALEEPQQDWKTEVLIFSRQDVDL